MIRYSLKQLRYFLVAAELGSTSEAARVLHVSQPSISTAIKQLESVFDRTLVFRLKGQGVTPTPYGREMMLKIRNLLSLADNLHNQNSEPAGAVLIGCFVDISPYYLPGILSELLHKFPDIRPGIVNGELDEIPLSLKRGELDLAISYGVLLDREIYQEKLITVTPHALLPRSHPLAKLDVIPLQKLLNEPFILSDAPYSGEYLFSVLASLGMSPEIAYNAQTFELQRSMVANALGVSLVYTQPLCDKSYDGKSLVFRPIVEPLPTQDIVLVRHNKTEMTPTTRAVWELIRNSKLWSEQLKGPDGV